MGTPLVLEDFMRWHETRALLHTGHADLARADVERFEQLVGESRRHQLVLLRMQAVLAAYDGDAPGAVTTLIAAQALAQEIGLPGELWQLHAAHGDLLREMGQGEQAQVAYTQANALLDDLAGRFTDETLRIAFLSSPLARHVHSQDAM